MGSKRLELAQGNICYPEIKAGLWEKPICEDHWMKIARHLNNDVYVVVFERRNGEGIPGRCHNRLY
jgi:hypothetical protein